MGDKECVFFKVGLQFFQGWWGVVPTLNTTTMVLFFLFLVAVLKTFLSTVYAFESIGVGR